jgi:hypothetical protein
LSRIAIGSRNGQECAGGQKRCTDLKYMAGVLRRRTQAGEQNRITSGVFDGIPGRVLTCGIGS